MGCAEEVDTGVVPNEYGTWLYGRDGWCNGREVAPWVVDVTADLRTAPRANATLTYTALWCANATVCAPPDPGPPSAWSQAAPVAMVSVYLVFSPQAPSEELLWMSIGGSCAVMLVVAAMVAFGCRQRQSTSGGHSSPLLLDVGADPTAEKPAAASASDASAAASGTAPASAPAAAHAAAAVAGASSAEGSGVASCTAAEALCPSSATPVGPIP